MNTQNIASLAEALEKLGFDSLQTTISTYISLQLPRFIVPFTAVRNEDVMRFQLVFETKDGACSCFCYDAFLRKEIAVPDVIINDVQVKDLDDQMGLINWKELFANSQDFASIIEQLTALDSSRHGKEYCEQLKIKHWSDTPLESIMSLSVFKSKYEIGQRFYFFEGGKGISVEEAYRFLNNKWMEKQLKKKVASPPAETKPVVKVRSKKPKASKT